MLNRRVFTKTMVGGVICAASPVQAWAHRQKQALSTIEWNAHAQLLEITHDIHAHDAEMALARLGLIDTPDITGLRARARLALYVRKNFIIKTLAGQNIDLTIIGAEVDSTYAHVYMEAKLDKAPTGLIVTDTIMQDVFIDQINQVNMSIAGKVQSVVFTAGDAAKKLLA